MPLERPAGGHLPKSITSDNGTEFTSKDFDAWAFRRGVALDLIRPGKPTETGFCESLNGRFRDECLNAEVFLSIEDAKKKIRNWKTEYNTERPPAALGNLSPREYLRRRKSKALANHEFLDPE